MKYSKYFKKLFIQKSKINELDILLILNKLQFKKTFKIFHVGGTNGKGTVSNYLQQGFMNKYDKVGLFTSPHIMKLNERIKINDEEISDYKLHQYCQKVLKINKNIPFPTLMYVIALLYFKDQNIKLAVIEVGIGGRHDSTKLVGGEYGVITSVSLDHTEILGNSIEEIARDKAGIMMKDMVYFVPIPIKSNIKNIFIDEAETCGAKIINVPCDIADYRIYNKSLSQGILKYFDIMNIKFKDVFGRTSIVKHRGIEHILDVAHNYSGIKASLDYLKNNNIEYQNICLSLSIDKDVNRIGELLENNIYVYSNSGHKSMKLSSYSMGAKVNNIVEFINNLTKTTLFIGSFYFIGDIMKVMNE